jgi:hypothetical protein
MARLPKIVKGSGLVSLWFLGVVDQHDVKRPGSRFQSEPSHSRTAVKTDISDASRADPSALASSSCAQSMSKSWNPGRPVRSRTGRVTNSAANRAGPGSGPDPGLQNVKATCELKPFPGSWLL